MELLGDPASVNPNIDQLPRPMDHSSGGYAATVMGNGQSHLEAEEPQKPVSLPPLLIANFCRVC